MATHKLAQFPGYTIRVSATQDDCPIEGSFASGDEEFDRATEREIEDRLNCGDVWAWAHVEVKVIHDNFALDAMETLGCCNYIDEKEFVTSEGYFPDMVATCVQEIEAKIAKIRAA